MSDVTRNSKTLPTQLEQGLNTESKASLVPYEHHTETTLVLRSCILFRSRGSAVLENYW